MVRKSRRGRILDASVLGDGQLASDVRHSLQTRLSDRHYFQRIGATLMFFVTVTPLILFGLTILYQIWHSVQGSGQIDTWTFWVVTPLGVLFSPVLFYLGWYFQTRAKGQYVALETAMGGHFQAFCATLYGLLAVLTIGLAIIGAVGTALVGSNTESNVVLITWAGMALVGIGLLSWLFRSMQGDVHMLSTSLLVSQPTGIALVMFSAVWLYPCAIAFRSHDWLQFRGVLMLFLVFLIPGCLVIWLSGRKRC